MFYLPGCNSRTDRSAEEAINIVCFVELNFNRIENWETLNYATDLFVRAECLCVCVCVSESERKSKSKREGGEGETLYSNVMAVYASEVT